MGLGDADLDAKPRLTNRILWIVVISAVLATLATTPLIAMAPQLAWQHIAFTAAFAALAGVAYRAKRRLPITGPERALETALAAMLVVSTAICLLVRLPQVLIGTTFAFIVLVSAPRILPRQRTDRWVAISIITALALVLSDFLPIPFRIETNDALLQPLELTIAAAVAAFAALVLRDLRRFPVQTKIYLMSLILAVVPTSLVISAFRSGVVERERTEQANNLERRASILAHSLDAYVSAEKLALAELALAPEMHAACARQDDHGAAALLEVAVESSALRRSIELRSTDQLLLSAGPPSTDPRSHGLALSVRTLDPALGSQLQLRRRTASGCELILDLQPGLLRAWTRAAATTSRGAIILRDGTGSALASAGDLDLRTQLDNGALPPVPTSATRVLPQPPLTALVQDPEVGVPLLALVSLPTSGWSLVLIPSAQTPSAANVAIRRALLLALLVAGLTTLAAFYLGRHFGRPLQQLNDGLARFTAGAITTRVEVDAEDEVADLAESFNTMASQVGSLLYSLEQQAKRLQAEIAERTEQEVHLQALNEELSDARDQAMAANRAKSAFLAGMSHELRTPLNAIIGYAELLHEDASDAELTEMAADAETVANSAKHLLALINDILDLSRIESGRLNLTIEEFDVEAMLKDVVLVAQPLVDRQGNNLRLSIDRTPVRMLSDPTKIRQCIFNLVSNAAKFTENGTIELKLYHQEIGVLPCLVFEVTDSGIGIDDEALANLFRAFSQVDSELARKHTGTGLGLTITRRLARKLGGDIQVSSLVGVGTTFTVRLPQHYQASSESMTWGQSIATAIERSSASLRVPIK